MSPHLSVDSVPPPAPNHHLPSSQEMCADEVHAEPQHGSTGSRGPRGETGRLPGRCGSQAEPQLPPARKARLLRRPQTPLPAPQWTRLSSVDLLPASKFTSPSLSRIFCPHSLNSNTQASANWDPRPLPARLNDHLPCPGLLCSGQLRPVGVCQAKVKRPSTSPKSGCCAQVSEPLSGPESSTGQMRGWPGTNRRPRPRPALAPDPAPGRARLPPLVQPRRAGPREERQTAQPKRQASRVVLQDESFLRRPLPPLGPPCWPGPRGWAAPPCARPLAQAVSAARTGLSSPAESPCLPPLAHSTDKTEGLSGPAGHIGRLFTSSPGGGGAGGWKDGQTHPGGVPGGGGRGGQLAPGGACRSTGTPSPGSWKRHPRPPRS